MTYYLVGDFLDAKPIVSDTMLPERRACGLDWGIVPADAPEAAMAAWRGYSGKVKQGRTIDPAMQVYRSGAGMEHDVPVLLNDGLMHFVPMDEVREA